MSARKISFYKPPAGGPAATGSFPIPEGELVKIEVIAQQLPPFHPECKVHTATSLTEYVESLDATACLQLMASLKTVVEPANSQPNKQN